MLNVQIPRVALVQIYCFLEVVGAHMFTKRKNWKEHERFRGEWRDKKSLSKFMQAKYEVGQRKLCLAGQLYAFCPHCRVHTTTTWTHHACASPLFQALAKQKNTLRKKGVVETPVAGSGKFTEVLLAAQPKQTEQ